MTASSIIPVPVISPTPRPRATHLWNHWFAARLAIHEMTDLGTPPAVVIDEAIELARQFSGEESVSFINGVLDAVRRGLP